MDVAGGNDAFTGAAAACCDGALALGPPSRLANDVVMVARMGACLAVMAALGGSDATSGPRPDGPAPLPAAALAAAACCCCCCCCAACLAIMAGGMGCDVTSHARLSCVMGSCIKHQAQHTP